MRTIIELTDGQLEALARISRQRRLSRAELIRQAIDRYLAEQAPKTDAAFGLWKRAGRQEDGLAYQLRVRKEWAV
jgi:metal-responsive CopG/Arc/MetJ family transcriptional regulator